MYENFVISTQHDTYLMIGKSEDLISAIKFRGASIKYGSPNDESRGGHSLSRFGDLYYGLYEVENSPWIIEQKNANRVHPRHSDAMFADRKHYIACFKDVMLEASCGGYELVQLSTKEILSLVSNEVSMLDE